jgi:peptidoglycan/LPS O-acetylase OafA/YrhL
MNVKRRVPVLDSVRGTAAVLVYLFHLVGLAQTFHIWHETAVSRFVGMLGPLGTNLLLLLCGFWITVSLRKPTFELGAFLRNRLVRIYVPYLAVVLLSYSAWALMPQLAPGKGGWGLESTLSNLLLIPGLFPDRPALTVA